MLNGSMFNNPVLNKNMFNNTVLYKGKLTKRELIYSAMIKKHLGTHLGIMHWELRKCEFNKSTFVKCAIKVRGKIKVFITGKIKKHKMQRGK